MSTDARYQVNFARLCQVSQIKYENNKPLLFWSLVLIFLFIFSKIILTWLSFKYLLDIITLLEFSRITIIMEEERECLLDLSDLQEK